MKNPQDLNPQDNVSTQDMKDHDPFDQALKSSDNNEVKSLVFYKQAQLVCWACLVWILFTLPFTIFYPTPIFTTMLKFSSALAIVTLLVGCLGEMYTVIKESFRSI